VKTLLAIGTKCPTNRGVHAADQQSATGFTLNTCYTSGVRSLSTVNLPNGGKAGAFTSRTTKPDGRATCSPWMRHGCQSQVHRHRGQGRFRRGHPTFSGNDNDTVTCPGGALHKIANPVNRASAMAMPGSGAKEKCAVGTCP